jgi:hypothetical protein
VERWYNFGGINIDEIPTRFEEIHLEMMIKVK